MSADHLLTVSDHRTIREDLETSTYSGSWGDWTTTATTSGTVFVLELDETMEGEVDSATASTVVDANFDEADSFWNGTTLEFTNGDCEGEKRRVIAFASSTGTFTLNVLNNPLPASPAAGDDFVLHGYPIVPATDLHGHDHGSISSEQVTFQVRDDNGASSKNAVTATAGRKIMMITVKWTAGGATEIQNFGFTIDVRPST